MKILSESNQLVQTLEDWQKYCPPAKAIHWKDARSAKETAKAWLYSPPVEFLSMFGSTISVTEIYPEHKTKFDDNGGNVRNHDLLVLGKDLDGNKMVTCVESKVDEPFGDILSTRITKAESELKKNPNSRVLLRIADLRNALFGAEEEKQLELRYQLLTAAAGTMAEGTKQGVKKVFFVVQTLLSANMDSKQHRTNQRDLDIFVEQISKGRFNVIHNGDILGPILVKGNKYINSNVELYIGKIDIRI